MTVSFRPAKREAVGLLIGLAGASGSGKSFSALRLARGLAGAKPFAVVDTEAGRMLHYADSFQPWEHAELHAPFTPGAYAEAIKTADEAGYPVIVVDSASHEHAGEGGLLDMFDAEFERMGSRDTVKMSAWIKPKSEHKRFVSRLLQVRAHVILNFRAESKVEIVKENGKTVVRPKRSLTSIDGWIPITEKSLPFELTLSLLLTPDAPGIPKPIKLQAQHRPFMPLDQPLDERVGESLATWAAGDAAKPGEHDAQIAGLTDELLACADVLGNREDVMAAVAKNRRANSTALAKHVAWLAAQLERLQAAAGERCDEQISIPASTTTKET